MVRARIVGFLCLAFLGVVAADFYGASDVVNLDASSFDREVLKGDEIWAVEFYAPWCGHCKNLAPEWKKAAKALKGIARVGAVNMDEHASVGSPYNVRGFPTIKIFGADKSSPSDYNGGRTAEAIVDDVLIAVKRAAKARLSGGSGGGSRGSNSGGGGSRGNAGGNAGGAGAGAGGADEVLVLTESNFDATIEEHKVIMVEFYAPWCGHCKNLEPAWREAAGKLKGKVALAKVDATQEGGLAQRFGVSGYPTIKVFENGEASDYEGGRAASAIESYALDLYEAHADPPKVLEILSDDELVNACAAGKTCVISFLPHILDTGAAGRNEHLSVLSELAKKHRRSPFSWLWTSAGVHESLEASLGVGGYGYPAVVAFNRGKMLYAPQRSGFSGDAVSQFLFSLLRGSEKLTPVSGMPALNAVEPWDGQDGEAMVEEEFSLDDILGDGEL